jgi:hypothetical protein
MNRFGFPARIVQFDTTSRSVRWPAPSAVHWVPGAMFLELKRPGRQVDLVVRLGRLGSVPSLPECSCFGAQETLGLCARKHLPLI